MSESTSLNASNEPYRRGPIISDVESGQFRQGTVVYLSDCPDHFQARFSQAREAIKMNQLSRLQTVVPSMTETYAQSIQHCLDVCVIVHGDDDLHYCKYPMTLLAYAGYYGRKHMVDFLILQGASIDMGNPRSGTPLTQMIMHCYHQKTYNMLDTDIVQYFVQKGAILSRVMTAGSWENSSALELSTACNQIDVVKVLVEEGVDPIFGGDPQYNPVFSEYLQFGTHQFLSWLLHERFTAKEIPAFIDELIEIEAFTYDDNHTGYHLGRNPCHAFLLCGHQKATHYLIDKKPDLLKECDPYGKTALHIAAEKGDLTSINSLLAKNPDMNATDSSGMTPLRLAAKNGHQDVVLKLMDKRLVKLMDKRLEQLQLSEETEEVDAVATPITGDNPFKRQSQLLEELAHTEIPTKLWALQYGISTYFEAMHKTSEWEDVLQKPVDEYGNTIAHLAAESGNIQIFKTTFPLEQSGDDRMGMLTWKNHQGKTPLHIAIEKGNVRILELLQQKRAEREESAEKNIDIDQKMTVGDEKKEWETFWEMEGLHILFYSCKHGTVDVVKYLVSIGVDPKAESSKGCTPLSCAAEAGHHEIVTYLLGVKGVSPDGSKNQKKQKKYSPLLLAAKKGHAKCVKILMEKKANVTVTSARGYNCLMEAIQGGHKETAIAILSNERWKKMLQTCQETKDHQDSCHISTPMRMMIELMPDVAEMVLNKSIKMRNRGKASPCPQEILYSYEFIEDQCEEETAIHFRFPHLRRTHHVNPPEDDQPDAKQTELDVVRIHVQDDTTFRHSTEEEHLSECSHDEKETEEQGSDSATFLSEEEDEDDSGDRECETTDENEEGHPPDWGPKEYCTKCHPLALMVKYHRLKLLQHPLIHRYIQYKWWKFVLPLFLMYLLIYVLFLALLTGFALTSPRPGPDNENCPSNDTDSHFTRLILRDNECKDPAGGRQEALTVLSITLILLSIVYLVIEISQVVRRKWKYFLAYENYIQISVFVFTIIFVFGFFNDCWCATPWQWQIGALAVFLAWFNIIVLLKDMPWVGIHINMLFNIITTFLKLIFLPVLLITAFSLPFYMLFVRNVAGVMGVGSPGVLEAFSSPFHAVAKTIMQTAGELDYETLFNDADLLYSPMAYALFISFVIIMPILFSNLLIGLAVGDTNVEIEKATFTRIMLQVDFLLEWEGLHFWPRCLMKLRRLEFKKRKYNWTILRWWDELWGIDFKTQQEVKEKCCSEKKDFISCINKPDPKEQKIVCLNDKIVQMEGRILDFEKTQTRIMESLSAANRDITQVVQDLKQLVEKLQQKY